MAPDEHDKSIAESNFDQKDGLRWGENGAYSPPTGRAPMEGVVVLQAAKGGS